MEEKPAQDKQNWLYKIVILPKYFGEAIFNLLGKNNTSEGAKFILGYMLLAGLFLLALSIISPESAQALLAFIFK